MTAYTTYTVHVWSGNEDGAEAAFKSIPGLIEYNWEGQDDC